jgi:hypothetical protein
MSPSSRIREGRGELEGNVDQKRVTRNIDAWRVAASGHVRDGTRRERMLESCFRSQVNCRNGSYSLRPVQLSNTITCPSLMEVAAHCRRPTVPHCSFRQPQDLTAIAVVSRQWGAQDLGWGGRNRKQNSDRESVLCLVWRSARFAICAPWCVVGKGVRLAPPGCDSPTWTEEDHQMPGLPAVRCQASLRQYSCFVSCRFVSGFANCATTQGAKVCPACGRPFSPECAAADRSRQ